MRRPTTTLSRTLRGSAVVMIGLAMTLAGACGDSGDPASTDDGGTDDPLAGDGGDGDDGGSVDLPGVDGATDVPDDGVTDIADDTPLELPPSRAVHRMTVEQLMASIPVVTGGLTWEEDFGDGPQNMLEQLAPTLGAPDYVLVVEENLEPSMIIAKFVADAANRVCAKWIQRDRSLPAADRTLVVHEDWSSLDEDDVKASLRRLALRFFSRHVTADDDAAIAPLYDLFLAASGGAPAGKAADDGWLAVCLALMNDPEFVLY